MLEVHSFSIAIAVKLGNQIVLLPINRDWVKALSEGQHTMYFTLQGLRLGSMKNELKMALARELEGAGITVQIYWLKGCKLKLRIIVEKA